MEIFQPATSSVGPAIKFDKPSANFGKFYNTILQVSIVFFGGALVWFSFVYYPKIVSQYKNVPVPVAQNNLGKVSANFSGFPIEATNFRITYEPKPNSYYVFVKGDDLPAFVDNKNQAVLALKSALSIASVCNLNIFYVSTAQLGIPDSLKVSPNC